jgi:hypothetical protein
MQMEIVVDLRKGRTWHIHYSLGCLAQEIVTSASHLRLMSQLGTLITIRFIDCHCTTRGRSHHSRTGDNSVLCRRSKG